MQIISYNKYELQKFIESDFFKQLKKIPISKHRAISHINNPYCADDDVLLWAAYEDNMLMGYLGVLPDMIVRNNREEKIYWASCFWTDKAFRKTEIAATLFFSLIEKYEKQLFIAGFTPSLERPYQKSGIFQPTQHRLGDYLYRNLAFSERIKTQFPKLKSIVPLYSLVEKCFNFTLFLGRKLIPEKITPNFSMVENTIFDAEFDDFVKKYCNENQLVVRSSSYFDWIIKYPWVLQGTSDKESERYNFSSKAEQFEYHSVKIYKGQQMEGFMLLKIRDKRLTISFSYLNDICVQDAVNFIFQIANAQNLTVIISFDDKLSSELKKKRLKYIFSKKNKKQYLFPLHYSISFDAFNEGEGDSVFS